MRNSLLRREEEMSNLNRNYQRGQKTCRDHILKRGQIIILLGLTVITLVAPRLPSGQNPPSQVKYPDLPSEMPRQFQPVTNSFDFTKREFMIPMRDGVELHAVIYVPRGAQQTPILLMDFGVMADAKES
jgi:predicted acyl esterase